MKFFWLNFFFSPLWQLFDVLIISGFDYGFTNVILFLFLNFTFLLMFRVVNRRIYLFNNFYNDYTKSFINMLTKQGKKEVAEKLMLNVCQFLKKKYRNVNPMDIIKIAIDIASPTLSVKFIRLSHRSRKTKGIPFRLFLSTRRFLSCRWIIFGAKERLGRSFAICIANEFLAIIKGTSLVFSKGRSVLNERVLENRRNLFSKRYFLPNK